ncbi:uncharacterized protein LOC110266060 [Arachis ipaensis]|uniref:uncharacterized protein LOC110266060 n=1 Tax=Arachis ipaensis TaxID=130454 RepID=UPI000A2B0264|nr:uncharacterized protein LOC110266060 [Arachis ipaensis]XP_025669403.1 uncharacterized protein LOC112769174 [Arachis hypogaea]
MLMKSFPEINTVLVMLTQQERQLNCELSGSKIVTNSLEVQSSAGGGSFPARGGGHGRSTGRGGTQKSYGREYTSKLCSYCNRIGHLAETCCKKNGFPAHLKQRVANQISTEGTVENSSAEITDSGSDEKSSNKVLELTPDQKETLLALLQQPFMPASNSVNHIFSSATLTQPKGTPIIEDDWANVIGDLYVMNAQP